MNINLPPETPVTYDFHDTFRAPAECWILIHCTKKLNSYFKDKNFENRYLPRFEWFIDLFQPRTILNIGAGRGRETFSLLWTTKASHAFGIDNDSNKIDDANDLVSLIEAIINSHLPALHNFNPRPKIYTDYMKQLNSWYKLDYPKHLKNLYLPKFIHSNIETMNFPENHFDLIYCRYVLHETIDNKNDIKTIAKNIARALKSQTGRFVLVEPTIKGVTKYDFTPFFLEVKLQLFTEEITDENLLGGADIFKLNATEGRKGKKPKGSIFFKPQ